MKISDILTEDSDHEIRNYKKLDKILVKLCKMVVKGQKTNPDKYGVVAAAVLDPDNNLVTGINLPAGQGLRKHAERVAIDNYISKYGDIPNGSIILTTCSPCSEHMDERYGESCTDLINNSNVKKVYCGYDDPTQDEDQRDFNVMETANSQIRNLCERFADTFLDPEKQELDEVFNSETSFPIEWNDRHGPAEMHGRAYDRQGGFIDIKFIALRNGVVEVEFSRNDSYDMTGAGDANRVLATILEAFREYLQGYRPKIFVFSAKGGSRSKVYQNMINRFAAGAGYKQFDTAKLSDKARKQLGHSGSDVMVLRRAAVEEDRHPNDRPYGPETKPTMPKGTVRVDVSDVYDWYKLGMNVSNLKDADKKIFGKGPPSTIMSFGDEDTEHKYIKDLEKLGLTTTDIDPVDRNQPRGMKRQKTDPTFNVAENFADGKVKGKSRPGRVKRAGASCNGSVTDLRARAKNASGEKAKMYHWCANMKSGRNK